MTRIQKERFEDVQEYEKVKNCYQLNAKNLGVAKDNMIAMHPLPRAGEIDEEIDFDPRSAYFRQINNGLYVRMALLETILC